VMRHREAVDVDVAYRKGGAGLKAIELGSILAPGNRGSRQPRDVDRDIELFCDRHQSADMIGVLMSNEHGMQILEGLIDSGESCDDVALAESDVHQDASPVGSDEGAVAGTAAREHTNFEDSASASCKFQVRTVARSVSSFLSSTIRRRPWRS